MSTTHDLAKAVVAASDACPTAPQTTADYEAVIRTPPMTAEERRGPAEDFAGGVVPHWVVGKAAQEIDDHDLAHATLGLGRPVGVPVWTTPDLSAEDYAAGIAAYDAAKEAAIVAKVAAHAAEYPAKAAVHADRVAAYDARLAAAVALLPADFRGRDDTVDGRVLHCRTYLRRRAGLIRLIRARAAMPGAVDSFAAAYGERLGRRS